MKAKHTSNDLKSRHIMRADGNIEFRRRGLTVGPAIRQRLRISICSSLDPI